MLESHQSYRRSYKELEKVASKFWSSELSDQEARLSVIPLLLQTQDQFISILSVEVYDLDNLFDVVHASTLPTNLFVKHLVVLADLGGEPLQRISSEFQNIFPQHRLNYSWRGEKRFYDFRALPYKSFSNKSLQIDGKSILEDSLISDLQRDAIALLLFASTYSDANQAASILSKCEVGEYLGKPEQLATFIKQRYLWVSRITGGAQANSLGQIAQQFVYQYLQSHLGLNNISILSGGRLPGVTHTDSDTERMTSFDLVVTDSSKYAAIEISFQVTTNSTIERKSGQARARYEQVEREGHKIAYVIDGAGNFKRETALRVICSYSHCTVAFSHIELDILCEFLQKYFAEE